MHAVAVLFARFLMIPLRFSFEQTQTGVIVFFVRCSSTTRMKSKLFNEDCLIVERIGHDRDAFVLLK